MVLNVDTAKSKSPLFAFCGTISLTVFNTGTFKTMCSEIWHCDNANDTKLQRYEYNAIS